MQLVVVCSLLGQFNAIAGILVALHQRLGFSCVSRDLLHLLSVLTILFIVAIIYYEKHSTTYRTADGGCQSLTVHDDCY